MLHPIVADPEDVSSDEDNASTPVKRQQGLVKSENQVLKETHWSWNTQDKPQTSQHARKCSTRQSKCHLNPAEHFEIDFIISSIQHTHRHTAALQPS